MPDSLSMPSIRWPLRIVALLLIAGLSYLAWRGYQQPEMIIDFGNLRFC